MHIELDRHYPILCKIMEEKVEGAKLLLNIKWEAFCLYSATDVLETPAFKWNKDKNEWES